MIFSDSFSDSFSGLHFFKVFIFLFFLAAAGKQDFFTKTVSDRIWLILLFILFPTAIFEICIVGLSHLFDIFFSVFIVFLCSFLCFYFGIFGGADCKAFLCIAVFFPISFPAPFSVLSFLFAFVSSFVFSVLINSLLFAFVFSFALLLFSASDFKKMSFKKRLQFKIPFFIPLFFGFFTAATFGNLLLLIVF